MAMTIRLQGEDGAKIEEVYDVQGVIATYLPLLSDQSYHCVKFIDPYGNAYFNQMQIQTFLAEWDRIFDKVEKSEAKQLAAKIRALAELCLQEPHLYLKFIGD